MRRRGLREEERRAQVGADEIFPFGRGDRAERRRVEGRSIVDEAVEAAKGVRRFGDHAIDRGEVEEVGLHDDARPAALRIELGGEALRLGARAVAVKRDLGAGGVQLARDRGADPFRRARDEDCAVVHDMRAAKKELEV